MDYTSAANYTTVNGKRGYRNRDKANGVEGTSLVADDRNAVMFEIMKVIEMAGLDPNATDWTQLYQAIIKVVDQAATSASVGFTPVEQGGVTGQVTVKVNIGWNGTDGVLVAVQGANKGTIAFRESTVGTTTTTESETDDLRITTLNYSNTAGGIAAYGYDASGASKTYLLVDRDYLNEQAFAKQKDLDATNSALTNTNNTVNDNTTNLNNGLNDTNNQVKTLNDSINNLAAATVGTSALTSGSGNLRVDEIFFQTDTGKVWLIHRNADGTTNTVSLVTST